MKDLIELLPTVYRLRDAAQGDPLRALLRVIGREVQRVEDDIERLYDNWFIETCDEWVVPYLGDLLGVRMPLDASAADGSSASSRRSYVANTLSYRRRKGTAAVLEQLARDVTGWRCRAVEFFERTASAQHANHPRPDHRCTLDIRSAYRNQFYGTPFEDAAHLAEVRHIDNRRGRYNVPNVGLFVWRLSSYRLRDVSARRIDSRRFTFDPQGQDRALFSFPSGTAPAGPTRPADVPQPLTRLTLHHDLPEYYGDADGPRSVQISTAGIAQPAGVIRACNLSDAAAGWAHEAPAGTIAIDPELGRIAFDAAPAGEVTATYAYGFGGDLGGGPYDRRGSLDEVLAAGVGWQMGVSHAPAPGQTQIVATLSDAVKEWNEQPPGTNGVIALTDSRTYEENLTTSATRIKVPQGSRLTIVAAGWPADDEDGVEVRRAGRLAPSDLRPHLLGSLEVIGTAPADAEAPGRLTINGVLLEGALRVRTGNLAELHLIHCTLAPGASTLTIDDNPDLTVELRRTVCGSVKPRASATVLRVHECIVDGDVEGRAVHIDASTVFGTTAAETLDAGNSILLGTVTVQRRQQGCVRFSYLPPDSQSPRRYRCQPADPARAAQLKPKFESTTYGEPAYAQLIGSCAAEISTGADDEGEMGAWHFVHAPQRLRNLRLALDEYLRFGLEAGVLAVSQQPRVAAVVRKRAAKPPTKAPARRKKTAPRTRRPK